MLLVSYLPNEVRTLGVSQGTRDVPSRELLYAQSGPDIGPLTRNNHRNQPLGTFPRFPRASTAVPARHY